VVQVKRIYDPPQPEDGLRLLVDGLWPRGVRKDQADFIWRRDLAPSPELRRFYSHQPERFAAFRERYRAELEGKPELIAELRRLAAEQTVTLLYAARDRERNNATVLAELVEEGL
jgi:uncharacterized protein YeaO (DUF488 family)